MNYGHGGTAAMVSIVVIFEQLFHWNPVAQLMDVSAEQRTYPIQLIWACVRSCSKCHLSLHVTALRLVGLLHLTIGAVLELHAHNFNGRLTRRVPLIPSGVSPFSRKKFMISIWAHVAERRHEFQ
jgi:hypothetical protein